MEDSAYQSKYQYNQSYLICCLDHINQYFLLHLVAVHIACKVATSEGILSHLLQFRDGPNRVRV